MGTVVTVVKIIESYSSQELEKSVNGWIETEKPTPELIDIKLTVTPLHNLYQSQPPMVADSWVSYIATITYKDII